MLAPTCCDTLIAVDVAALAGDERRAIGRPVADRRRRRGRAASLPP